MNRRHRQSTLRILIVVLTAVLLIPSLYTFGSSALMDGGMPASSGEDSEGQSTASSYGASAIPLGGSFAAFGTSYTIELARWGIDGTPVHNSNGLNNALDWAAQQGYSEIIFPAGEYVISERQPINIRNMRDTTIDMNGAVLRINTNGLTANKIVTMRDCRNVVLMNGTILGDIDAHDYAAGSDTSGNLGIEIGGGCVDCQLDNMLIKDIAGWGFVTSRGADYASTRHYVSYRNLERGSIDPDTGDKIADSSKIRTKAPVDISEFDTFEEPYFILGVDTGYSGYPYLSARSFDVIFYDSGDGIIDALQNQPVYKKIPIPDNVASADFVFHQSSLPTNGDSDFDGAVIFITHHIQPTRFQVTNTVIDNCRSLGMAICGGDDMTIQNCTIKNTQDYAPGYAVNFEDGWEYMNDIKFIDNTFEGNPKDLVVCAGDNALFQGNRFGGWVYVWDRTTNFTFEDNIFENTFSWPVLINYECSTNAVIRNNTYINTNVMIQKTRETAEVIFDHEYFYNANINAMSGGAVLTNSRIESDRAEAVRISGTYENCDIDIVQGELVSSSMYHCRLRVVETARNQEDTLYDNCTITGSHLSTTTNTGSITVNNCSLIDTVFTVTTWGSDTALDIQNSTVKLQGAPQAFVHFSPGKMQSLTLKNNTISNVTAYPVLNMFETIYSTPDAAIHLEGNTFEQTARPYIFDGAELASGAVRLTHGGNTIIGGAILLNPIYAPNSFFTISTDIGGNNGSASGGGNSSGRGSSSSGGGGSARSGTTASTTVIDRAYTREQFEADWQNAVGALPAGQTNVVITPKNYTGVDSAVLDYAYATAAKANKTVVFQFDTLVNFRVVSRVYVHPQVKNDATAIVNNQLSADKIAKNFGKFYSNSLSALSFGDGKVKIAARLPDGIAAENVVVYSYDAAKNTYTRIAAPIDENGYLHVESPTGAIVISDGALVRK